MHDETQSGSPARLPQHLEENGVEPAVEAMRDTLRMGGAMIADMGDADLLRNAAACEEEASEWPPDVLSSFLVYLYRAEVVHRILRSRQTDRRERFVRMARKAGFHYRFDD